MRREILCLCAALAAASERDARACGPDFPTEMLTQRDWTLRDLPEGIFLDEVAGLVPAPPYAVVFDDPPGVRATGGIAERILYDRGAAAFAEYRWDEAQRSFEGVLALPPAQRRHRSTWAAYMLGRLNEDPARYAQVRALVDDGFLDELGLAASSLGQEARLRLGVDDPIGAVRLYAAQAALFHPDGGPSLLEVVRDEVDAGEERELLGDRLGQRLVAAYLYSRGDDLTDAQRDRLWRELGKIRHLAGADRLAAAAYREGRWDTAARLAHADEAAPLSRRVLSKLALRDGDEAAAARLIAGVEASPRICEERATLALHDGRMPEAMVDLWTARDDHPDDVSYVAERVLSADELRDFVDRQPPPAPDEFPLRELLAHRLLREGDPEAALPYFEPLHRRWAWAFANALAQARASDDAVVRAGRLYQASRVARLRGLEILGTMHAPDWGYYDAQYDLDDGYREFEDSAPWTTDAERARVAASAPAWPSRYHYRWIASELAERAADQLPHGSQPFAAMLCWAARYVLNDNRARVDALWARYVREGPRSFDGDFGVRCPEPQLQRAYQRIFDGREEAYAAATR